MAHYRLCNAFQFTILSGTFFIAWVSIVAYLRGAYCAIVLPVYDIATKQSEHTGIESLPRTSTLIPRDIICTYHRPFGARLRHHPIDSQGGRKPPEMLLQ